MTDGLFLGIDGGGTKTEFVCMDSAGTVLARATTGTTYHLQVGFDEAVRRLEQGLAAVCSDLAITPAGISHAFFGLPAYGEDSIADPQLHTACGHLLGHDRYDCGNDMICGWAGSLACQDGINIIAGTGSIGYGECEGRSARVGGWGEVFGDEGSAYWIAVQALGLFARMSDGRTTATALHGRIREALSLEHDLQLCERVHGPGGMERSELAGLARIVSAAAADGDPAARLILEAAADELAALARALKSRLGFGDALVPISCSGSVLAQDPIVRGRFLAVLKSENFTYVEPLLDPGHGAALYARKRLAT